MFICINRQRNIHHKKTIPILVLKYLIAGKIKGTILKVLYNREVYYEVSIERWF